MIQRGEHAPADTQRRGDGDAGGGQLSSPWQAGQDFAQYGLAAAHRRTQVEVHQPSQKGGVLHGAGLIEPKLMADVLDIRFAGQQTGADAGGIARQQADHHEDDQ